MIGSVQTQSEHVKEIVSNLRAHDRLEFELVGDPETEIKKTLKRSRDNWTWLVDGKVACMWGIKEESLITGAHIWLITTPLIERHIRRFLIDSRRSVHECLASYHLLYGFVDASFKPSIRWMEWIGFKPTMTIDIGAMKLIRYELRAS